MSAEKKLPISAIVLTFNEKRNLRACLDSLKDRVQEIFIVDSFSTDETREIAREYTEHVYEHEFINQSLQFHWALENLPLKTDWIMRVDADERWTEKGFDELAPLLADEKINGINVRMKIYFMGRFISHGSIYPNNFLRVFRRGKGSMEIRWMDEHIRVPDGEYTSKIDVLEQNYDRMANIGLWTKKHNSYSLREAVEYLLLQEESSSVQSVASLSGDKTKKKRWIKENVFMKIPLLTRPFLYFIYRYFFKFGFLDGKEGFVFHILQGFWYRFLVDVKIIELQRKIQKEGKSLRQILKDEYGMEVPDSIA